MTAFATRLPERVRSCDENRRLSEVEDVPLTDGNVPGVELSSANGAEVQMPIVDAFTWPIMNDAGGVTPSHFGHHPVILAQVYFSE